MKIKAICSMCFLTTILQCRIGNIFSCGRSTWSLYHLSRLQIFQIRLIESRFNGGKAPTHKNTPMNFIPNLFINTYRNDGSFPRVKVWSFRMNLFKIKEVIQKNSVFELFFYYAGINRAESKYLNYRRID